MKSAPVLTERQRREARRLIRLHREQLRRRARVDPNAFVEYVWRGDEGRYIRQGTIHRELQAHLSQHRRALIRFPRYHGKSTQCVCRAIWELGHNHNLRIKIACANDKMARKRVGEMKRHIRSPEVRAVFPDLKPRIGDWTKHEFTVERTANLLDHSVEAYGVMSGATGGRADILILDDITDLDNSFFSAARREAVKEALANKWMNLVHPTRDRVWWPGTPYHFDDAFHVKCMEPKDFALLDRKINKDLDPIWPERWPTEALEVKKEEDDRAFARGFHCFPIATEEQPFPPDIFKFWRPGDLPTEIDDDGNEVPIPLDYYMGIDPAFTEKRRNDGTAMTVIGVHGKTKYVVDFVNLRTRSNKVLKAEAFRLCYKWHPLRIGYETIQGQIMLAQDLREDINDRDDLAITVYDENPKERGDKEARMVLLADEVSGGRLLLRGDGPGKPHKSQELLYQQLVQFPCGDHDDGPDSLDFACQQVPRGSVDMIGELI